MRPFGLYVHFPYCTVHCPYCDFAVATERAIPQERYTRAVLAELALRAPGFEGLAPRSLYLGGGTPSLWDPERVAEVVAAVRARFALPVGAEVTLEANPEAADRGRFAAYAQAGVNRFSVGVQSLDPGVLAKLGRRHRPEDAERAVRAAAEAVEDVAVDLIYGARRSTVAIARADAARVAAWPVTHVSAYALTLDREALAEETPLARLRRQGRLPLPSDDEVVAQARALRGALRRGGLARYEISNFARPGFESVHNRLYWESESYLGLGVGAYGARHAEGGEHAARYGNARTPAAYLAAVEAGRLPTAEEDLLGPRELAEERLMLALRLREGAPLAAIAPSRRGEIEALVRARLAVVRGERLVLTSRGLDLHSAVAERLMP
ncbi:coproporphyrinogen-III oxidase family protein [Anaeromyxobacter diazotrophicus]|uniref:coproporphyrinogen-III oxidase family protein n=1 Tax=Anaeromyxobacter diazotrophicus TaxID=2590199 RepID=UPI001591634A|nr:coproporphyrinogen-III oxidase family protein [Anaeromyxobacter diazotrophicus]